MKRNTNLIFFLLLILIACLCLIHACTAATSQLHIVRYANDKTTVLNETTVTWQWMQANLPVLGDGTTHYYHQGPVFATDTTNVTHKEELRWNPAEDTNVQEKDYGAVKGTNLKDLCNLVGGLSSGEVVTLKASDGLTKNFAYKNVYAYSSRQGPMVITWARGTETPDTSYDEAMKLAFFADTSVNPWGIHAFGNSDWKDSADSQYWYYYYQGSEKYPTTTGLSVKYISDVIIYSNAAAPVALPPTAGFTASTVSGTAPLAVTFTDQSTNSPTSWAWDFTNDGTTDSTQQNPTYTFTAAGTYTVKLTTTNAHGSNSETKSAYITVSAATVEIPVAQFTASSVTGSAPLTVQFSDSSTGSPVSWSWDFTSDGTADSKAQSPSFTYTKAGTYTVTLTTQNSNGTSSQNSTLIQVSGIQPAAGFSADVRTGSSPLVVHFTDTSTGAGITVWVWDFENDGVIDSDEQNPTYTYTKVGMYPVNLTIYSKYGTSSALRTKYITVKSTDVTVSRTATLSLQAVTPVTTVPTVTASTLRTTLKKARTTVTTSSTPAASTPPAESPGPDTIAICGTLAACGFGTILTRKYLQKK